MSQFRAKIDDALTQRRGRLPKPGSVAIPPPDSMNAPEDIPPPDGAPPTDTPGDQPNDQELSDKQEKLLNWMFDQYDMLPDNEKKGDDDPGAGAPPPKISLQAYNDLKSKAQAQGKTLGLNDQEIDDVCQQFIGLLD